MHDQYCRVITPEPIPTEETEEVCYLLRQAMDLRCCRQGGWFCVYQFYWLSLWLERVFATCPGRPWTSGGAGMGATWLLHAVYDMCGNGIT